MKPSLCELGCLVSSKEKTLDAFRELLLRSIANSDRVCFKAGQVLFYQEHLPVGCFLLQSGKVNVERQEGKGKVNTETCHDSVIGLVHLINNSPLCASVVAQDDVETVFFPQPLVMSLFASWRKE